MMGFSRQSATRYSYLKQPSIEELSGSKFFFNSQFPQENPPSEQKPSNKFDQKSSHQRKMEIFESSFAKPPKKVGMSGDQRFISEGQSFGKEDSNNNSSEVTFSKGNTKFARSPEDSRRGRPQSREKLNILQVTFDGKNQEKKPIIQVNPSPAIAHTTEENSVKLRRSSSANNLLEKPPESGTNLAGVKYMKPPVAFAHNTEPTTRDFQVKAVTNTTTTENSPPAERINIPRAPNNDKKVLFLEGNNSGSNGSRKSIGNGYMTPDLHRNTDQLNTHQEAQETAVSNQIKPKQPSSYTLRPEHQTSSENKPLIKETDQSVRIIRTEMPALPTPIIAPVPLKRVAEQRYERRDERNSFTSAEGGMGAYSVDKLRAPVEEPGRKAEVISQPIRAVDSVTKRFLMDEKNNVVEESVTKTQNGERREQRIVVFNGELFGTFKTAQVNLDAPIVNRPGMKIRDQIKSSNNQMINLDSANKTLKTIAQAQSEEKHTGDVKKGEDSQPFRFHQETKTSDNQGLSIIQQKKKSELESMMDDDKLMKQLDSFAEERADAQERGSAGSQRLEDQRSEMIQNPANLVPVKAQTTNRIVLTSNLVPSSFGNQQNYQPPVIEPMGRERRLSAQTTETIKPVEVNRNQRELTPDIYNKNNHTEQFGYHAPKYEIQSTRPMELQPINQKPKQAPIEVAQAAKTEDTTHTARQQEGDSRRPNQMFVATEQRLPPKSQLSTFLNNTIKANREQTAPAPSQELKPLITRGPTFSSWDQQSDIKGQNPEEESEITGRATPSETNLKFDSMPDHMKLLVNKKGWEDTKPAPIQYRAPEYQPLKPFQYQNKPTEVSQMMPQVSTNTHRESIRQPKLQDQRKSIETSGELKRRMKLKFERINGKMLATGIDNEDCTEEEKNAYLEAYWKKEGLTRERVAQMVAEERLKKGSSEKMISNYLPPVQESQNFNQLSNTAAISSEEQRQRAGVFTAQNQWDLSKMKGISVVEQRERGQVITDPKDWDLSDMSSKKSTIQQRHREQNESNYFQVGRQEKKAENSRLEESRQPLNDDVTRQRGEWDLSGREGQSVVQQRERIPFEYSAHTEDQRDSQAANLRPSEISYNSDFKEMPVRYDQNPTAPAFTFSKFQATESHLSNGQMSRVQPAEPIQGLSSFQSATQFSQFNANHQNSQFSTKQQTSHVSYKPPQYQQSSLNQQASLSNLQGPQITGSSVRSQSSNHQQREDNPFSLPSQNTSKIVSQNSILSANPSSSYQSNNPQNHSSISKETVRNNISGSQTSLNLGRSVRSNSSDQQMNSNKQQISLSKLSSTKKAQKSIQKQLAANPSLRLINEEEGDKSIKLADFYNDDEEEGDNRMDSEVLNEYEQPGQQRREVHPQLGHSIGTIEEEEDSRYLSSVKRPEERNGPDGSRSNFMNHESSVWTKNNQPQGFGSQSRAKQGESKVGPMHSMTSRQGSDRYGESAFEAVEESSASHLRSANKGFGFDAFKSYEQSKNNSFSEGNGQEGSIYNHQLKLNEGSVPVFTESNVASFQQMPDQYYDRNNLSSFTELDRFEVQGNSQLRTPSKGKSIVGASKFSSKDDRKAVGFSAFGSVADSVSSSNPEFAGGQQAMGGRAVD